MKFDYCIMNPPYARSLHLKFLEKTIENADTVVNISPAGFIYDFGVYTNNKEMADKIIPHLFDYEQFDHRTSNDFFNTNNGIQTNLHIGVYKHDYTEGKPRIDETQYDIYKKIRYTFKRHLRNKFIRQENLSENGVKIFRYHSDDTAPYYENIICFKGRAVEGIDFDTKEEQTNFIESIKTWPYEFMYKIKDTNPAHLPWLDDYTHKWTNEDMYRIFDITKKERQFIEKLLTND